MMQPTELWFIRHGVTDWNQARRFQGQIDIALNEEGLRQAHRTGQRLAGQAIAAVYSSDLSRARQTAEPIARALGLELRLEPGLRERSYGVFEGMTHEQLQREQPLAYARWRSRDADFALPGGGESLAQVFERAHNRMLTLAQAHPGQTVVAVTHGGVLDCIHRIAAGLALDAPRRFDLLNAAINRVAWDGERFSVLEWADARHLEAGLDDVEARG